MPWMAVLSSRSLGDEIIDPACHWMQVCTAGNGRSGTD